MSLAELIPFLDGAPGITQNQLGSIGIHSIDDHLDRGLAGIDQVAGKIVADMDDPVDLAGSEQVFPLGHGFDGLWAKEWRQGEAGDQVACLRCRVGCDDGHRNLGWVEGHSVAEQKQQDQGHHQGQQDAAWIASDLQNLFAVKSRAGASAPK